MNDSESNFQQNNYNDTTLNPLNLDNLIEGISFVFVGPIGDLQNLVKQNQNLNNIYFVSRINNYRTLTDEFLEDSALVIINKFDNCKILEIINFPSPSIDWLSTLEKYQNNYQEQNDSQDLYKWGQLVKYDTEILCTNCGYIHSLEEGYTYPICPVCQSGLEQSPTDSDTAFWKNLN